MLKIFEKKIFLVFTVVLSYLTLNIFRSETSAVYRRSLFLFNNTFQLEAFNKIPKENDPNEKYLTFFTHSGFQNQLIQVENGILLAWYLNRTLILPKALLGEAFGWSPFEKLELHHRIRDKNTKCKRLRAQSPYSFSCPNPDKYALASFDELFDLSFAKQHVKIITRESSDFEWLARYFGIRRIGITKQETGMIKDGDILFFKGESRYDWRIFDMPRKTKFLGKYNDSLEISQLIGCKEKLIHFTSLFGTGKMAVRKPEHIEFLESLQKSITYNHPAVLAIAHKVIELLGGTGNFVGIHLRTADGPFVNAMPGNIENIISQLDFIQQSYIPYNHSIDDTRHGNLNEPNTLQTCNYLSKNSQMIIFLATDANYPHNDPKFSQLYKSYPCIFTLNDILSEDNVIWNLMDQYRTSHTNTSMRKFLIPLVDALVASKGHAFIGTEGSTFSGYIRRLHSHFWDSSKSEMQETNQK
ncbi:hypothetical protein K501DRAFT_242307 [Backusella circina FSU 941]|nr:hypothetical protein K501DRAFT_242307 [Backusella circina FSU 941]